MFKYKNTYLVVMAMLMTVTSVAQTASSNSSSSATSTNYLELLMVTIAGLLAVVIFALSNVLSMIAKKAVEVTKSGNKVMMIGFIVMGNLFANGASAQAAISDTTMKTTVVNHYGGLSATTFWTLSSVLALELLVIFLMVLFINNLWKVVSPAAIVVKEMDKVTSSWIVRTWNTLDKKFFTKAAPLEKEADILLDHDYDGIKELDNALPPWWKYGFYITIFIAVLYLLKYEIWHNGPNPTEEYNSEMISAKEQVDAYLASMKNNVDEKSVTMSDAAGIAAGQISYTKTCMACHGAKGEGGVGPNLTDNYWLHGGAVTDVFKTIKYGYPDKGMQSWQSTFSPVQMQELASYVKSLKGTNPPNAKAPQGDLFNEISTSVDSTNLSSKQDSVAEVK
jgi:cytochrome c oxidase cbb3-type subunit 3